MMKSAALWTKSEKHDPPAVWRFDKIAVAHGLERILGQMPVGEDGIVRIWLEWTPWRVAPRNGEPVIVARAALGNHQVILAFDFIEVRSFRPDSARAAPKFFEFAFEL